MRDAGCGSIGFNSLVLLARMTPLPPLEHVLPISSPLCLNATAEMAVVTGGPFAATILSPGEEEARSTRSCSVQLQPDKWRIYLRSKLVG